MYKLKAHNFNLNELEHRKLGWKVLILKYDLGKSLNKKCDLKWQTLNKNW